jgi:CRISPR/Cas system-associated exonuclease Cas4 (RecB family)
MSLNIPFLKGAKYAPFSYSKMSTHEQCPRKFKYQYIIKPPKKPQNIEPLLKGGAVHSILEHYPKKSPHKLADKYSHIVEEFLKSDDAKYILNHSCMNELDIHMTKELIPEKGKNKKSLFVGSVDRVMVSPDYVWLLDWKTGKYKQPMWQDFKQLTYYAIWFFLKYKHINKIKLTYYYIEHKQKNEIVVDRENIKIYLSEFLNKIEQIEKDETFEKNQSPLCNYCDYQEYCDKDNDESNGV